MSANRFGEALRKARVGRGFTLRAVAERIGVSITYLSDVERGERPPLSAERIGAVAAALSIRPDELLAVAGTTDAEVARLRADVDDLRQQLAALRDEVAGRR